MLEKHEDIKSYFKENISLVRGYFLGVSRWSNPSVNNNIDCFGTRLGSDVSAREQA